MNPGTRVAYRMIGDQVMDIVAALPPANREATAEVGNEYPNYCVQVEAMSNGKVSCIMGYEHNLMPEEAQENSRRNVPFTSQGVYEKRE